MRIIIETIPHDQQRYNTVGDYWIDPDETIQIRISKMGDIVGGKVFEKMIAVHELVELVLIQYRGVSIQDIDDFDKEFENDRKPGDLSEPGFNRDSPYRNEHAIATAVELMMCAHMDIPWQDYENYVNSLP